MIPKKIHYCWLSGDAYPEKIEECINSWKKKLPDYEFILWSKDIFDIETSIWVKEAFLKKKYAFAADYIRFYALYNYGGIYLDSDVEVLRTFDDLLDLPYFIGFDSSNSFEAAVMASEPGNLWVKLCLEYYNNRHFLQSDGSFDVKVLPLIMKEEIEKRYVIAPLTNFHFKYVSDKCIYVYPYTFFSPKRHDTGDVNVESYTYTIHHYAMSWIPYRMKFLIKVKRTLMVLLGVKTVDSFINVFSLRKIKDRMLKYK